MHPRFTHESGTIRKKQAIDVSKLKRLLCYESQHQSQSNEKSLVQFKYEKASNYLGTQSTFNLTDFLLIPVRPSAGIVVAVVVIFLLVFLGCLYYTRRGTRFSIHSLIYIYI